MITQMSDLKIERIYIGTDTTECPGGQVAGHHASCIRITHLPTMTMAQCGLHRSDFKNKADAMLMLELVLGSEVREDHG